LNRVTRYFDPRWSPADGDRFGIVKSSALYYGGFLFTAAQVREGISVRQAIPQRRIGIGGFTYRASLHNGYL
jgi:hypothetical protein